MFDVISEQQYHGVILDRMLNHKGNISSGLLHYEEEGAPAKLTFGPKDLLVSAPTECLLEMPNSTPFVHS